MANRGKGWGVDGDTADEERRLHAFALAMSDLRPFWPKVVPLFIQWMKRQFESQGIYWTGAAWRPLTPDYAARKSIDHPGRGILVAAGDLRRGASQPLRVATPRSLTLTIEWPKGDGHYDPAWHHLGEGNNPRRPLLSQQLNTEQQMELDEVGREYVNDTARRLGL